MTPGSSQLRSAFKPLWRNKNHASREGYIDYIYVYTYYTYPHIKSSQRQDKCRYDLWPEYTVTQADLICSWAELLQNSSLNTIFWNRRALIGWTSFTYSLITHVTVLLSVDICFPTRFVGFFTGALRVVISAQEAWYNSGTLKTVATFKANFVNTYTTDLGKREGEKKKCGLCSVWKKKHSFCFYWQFYQQ